MTVLLILVVLAVAGFVAYQIVNKKSSAKVEEVKPTIEVVDVVKKPKAKKVK